MKKILALTVSIALLMWPASAVPQCIVPPNGAVVKTASYSALAADTGKHIVMNCSSACTLTLPSTPQSPVWAIYVSSIGSTAAQVSPNGLNLDGSASTITLSGDLASGFWIDTDNTNYFSVRGNPGASVVTAAANFVSNNLVQGAGANKTASDSGIATGNVVTASSAAGAAGQLAYSAGANKALSYASLSPSTLTDGATITWAIASVPAVNATVTIAGNRTLNITNAVTGGTYVLRVVQDATGTRTLTLGTGCTWKVVSGGAGAITLSTAANSVDILSFYYGGTNCYANLGKNYN